MPSILSRGAHLPFGIPASLLGLIVKGDLAGQTIPTDRHGRKVYYAEAPALKPPSTLQAAQRARFKTAYTNWKATTAVNRENYRRLALRSNLSMTAANLWIHVSLRGDFLLLATLQRQTGITVTPPPYVP